MSISLALTSPSAIPNRDVLIATVQDWLDRDDIADRIPTFIQLAEAQFNLDLRCPEMENTVTFSASAEDNPIPPAASDYIAMRAIYIEGSPDRPLRAMAPSALKREFDGATGTPVAYCLVSGGIRLAPPPSSPVLLTMDYFARIEALSVTAPSNWMLEKHPGAYLYGTLFHAECLLDNATRASQWKMLLDETITKISRAARSNRFGAGPLVPNTATQVWQART
jgi:hypothetical protein